MAIARAVESAGPGDIVMIAGKGHERYQEVSGQRIPFSDEVAVRTVLGVAA
jgi:UDP-N-acetylmuramoyl-L-alanyl-D-glutamate--2,6-diaminopimelate ligase